MKFIENVVLRNRFLGGLREKFSETREGIHVSDLVLCLREAYFRKTSPAPLKDIQLMYFLDGANRHRALQGISGVECEVKVEALGVSGSIDMMENIPIEFKSTRAASILSPHYFRQLGYYAVLTGKDRGVLVIQRINNKETPFEFYDVTWTGEELEAMRGEIVERRNLLIEALERGDASKLPFMEEKWKCDNCNYVVVCKGEVKE